MAGSVPGVSLRCVPHGGKGAAVRAGMLAADGATRDLADADMATPPDQILPRDGIGAITTSPFVCSRIQRDGSDMRATQPGYRRLLGKTFHLLASAWVAGPVQDTQCGFSRGSAVRRRTTCSLGKASRASCSTSRGAFTRRVGVATDGDRADPLPDKRGSRMRASLGLSLRVAWDLFLVSLVAPPRADGQVARQDFDDRRPLVGREHSDRLACAAKPIPCCPEERESAQSGCQAGSALTPRGVRHDWHLDDRQVRDPMSDEQEFSASKVQPDARCWRNRSCTRCRGKSLKPHCVSRYGRPRRKRDALRIASDMSRRMRVGLADPRSGPSSRRPMYTARGSRDQTTRSRLVDTELVVGVEHHQVSN